MRLCSWQALCRMNRIHVEKNAENPWMRMNILHYIQVKIYAYFRRRDILNRLNTSFALRRYSFSLIPFLQFANTNTSHTHPSHREWGTCDHTRSGTEGTWTGHTWCSPCRVPSETHSSRRGAGTPGRSPPAHSVGTSWGVAGTPPSAAKEEGGEVI